ncbi:MAG: phosphoribosylformylglycinamidine cyclo-ligase [Candidatus Thermoplasmatota archaeon]|jgi:phosphoribosylformylglycinamidine cyclo-ligase|nr:phosphoribosylformylglycinamidine cyclo-ligase [Candidatus Thermoplasmatota archaeon]
MPKYKESGVDFGSIGNFRSSIIGELTFEGTKYKRAASIGHYSGLISFLGNYLAIHTDNVGTKTMMAQKYRYFDQIGYDLVGMNVNDVICMGAEPMAMVDYIAGSMLDAEMGSKIGKSINKACREAGISMVGGETASVPDLVRGIDISGTVIGYLEKGKEITGKKIKEKDRIIGLASNGIHSNGFSLIRKIYENRESLLDEEFNGEPFWKALLDGTKIYSKKIFELTQEFDIHGISHITGGGVRNVLRLREARFKLTFPEMSLLFQKIIKDGEISMHEAFEVFNMGIGMMIVSSKKEEDAIVQELNGFSPVSIGEVFAGKGVSVDNFGVRYGSYY